MAETEPVLQLRKLWNLQFGNGEKDTDVSYSCCYIRVRILPVFI